MYEFLRERMLQNPCQTLSDENRSFTYKETLEYSKALAWKLAQNKYGILCRSELNAGLGILSCLTAGKTAVPLSHRYGQAHTERIILHIGISHILTDENGALEVRQIADPMPELEDMSDVALILCTSGTTGTPKGAMITRENLITNLLDIERYFHIGDSDRILIARPLYHCAVLTGEFLISLCRGLNISFYNHEFNPVRLAREIVTRNISTLCGTPTLFYHLCQMAKRQKMPLPIKTVAVSGECMTEVVTKIMRSVLPDTAIYNVYGLTEASPRVSSLPSEQFDSYPLSVGFPLRNVEARTEGGELLIRGKSIMRGYYNDRDQTIKTLANGWLHTG
ncbi:MAG: class I adenylate-forming enzyme family protein, partial [Oscillospiraceae bacterium]|nr:class I adenylate-forming enzyme family protein [Oscillospiraceae bacterium]